MTVADRYRPGLDAAHVLAVCAHATGGRRGLGVRGRDGILVCILPSRRAAHSAGTALTRVGYDVVAMSSGRGRVLVVDGWSMTGLDTRLAALRTVLHELAGDTTLTARAVIERFRALPADPHTPQQRWELLNQAHAGLRDWVAARSGIHAPRGATTEPADVRIALRLRTATVLEQLVDDHAKRQLRVAGVALALFSHLHQQMDGDHAQATAIRWAGITFHLPSSSARDYSHLMSPLRAVPEFPGSAVGPGAPGNVAQLDPARRSRQRSSVPRLRP